MKVFVAIHAGCGVHYKDVEKGILVKHCISQALDYACLPLLGSDPVDRLLDILLHAMRVLELSGLTNAGYGSVLTMDGIVECDASIMCGTTGSFGSVGALSETLHATDVATSLLRTERKGLLTLMRIPPLMLVGSGALDYTKRHCPNALLSAVSSKNVSKLDSLATPKQSSAWLKYKKLIEHADSAAIASKKQKSAKKDIHLKSGFEVENPSQHGTVGVVVCDEEGRCASAVSSGGIWMKLPGRIGAPAIYGAGCYAVNQEIDNVHTSIACSATGGGEYLIKSRFAQRCVEELSLKRSSCSIADALGHCFVNQYQPHVDRHYEATNGALNGDAEKLCQNRIDFGAGVVGLRRRVHRSGSDSGNISMEVFWAHSAECLVFISYASIYLFICSYFVWTQKAVGFGHVDTGTAFDTDTISRSSKKIKADENHNQEAKKKYIEAFISRRSKDIIDTVNQQKKRKLSASDADLDAKKRKLSISGEDADTDTDADEDVNSERTNNIVIQYRDFVL